MLRELAVSVRITVIFLVIVCGAYPLIVWGITQAAFSHQANGSLVRGANGQVIGSSLLAQGFARPEYFQPRPSAAGSGYDSTQSSGTNLGPTSDKLINGVHKPKQANGQPDPSDFDGVKDLAAEYRTENGLAADALVPVDAVTRSASGLDPDISVENARLQAGRVAKARGVGREEIIKLLDENTTHPSLGMFGPSRVNVLALNLSLDKQAPMQSASSTAPIK